VRVDHVVADLELDDGDLDLKVLDLLVDALLRNSASSFYVCK
jgi:hypothetical protein